MPGVRPAFQPRRFLGDPRLAEPRLLFVCLGNICRSPAAEGVVRRAFAEAGIAAALDSAGTGGWHVGEPPDRRMQAAARKRGIDLSGLRARTARAEDFLSFDLILAMDASNFEDLQDIRPADATAELRRMLDFHPNPPRLDVPDPYYGGGDGFETVLDLLEGAAEGLVARFGAGR